MAHYGIFRQELAISYPTYGNALWEPDPGGQYNAVEVGDVGFIRRGYFQRLFNVLLPKDHPFHRNPSFVPEDHQPLETIHDHIVKNEIRTGSRQNSIHFCSQYVTLDSRGRGTSAFGPEDDSQTTFSCNGKQGALLSLPVPAKGEDTVAFGDFGKWMIKHIDTWFAFARGLGLGINRMEDIILVTGRHLTKSWVNVAFTQRRPDAGVSFDVKVSGHSHVSLELEQEYVRGGDLKLGPTGRYLPENQCIFIRGFRVVRILGMWPKLRGQAGPAPNAGDQEPEPEADPQLELISTSDDSNDPLHDLLQYVAKEAPDCDMVLVHDNDLACMDVDLRTALRTHDFMGFLRKTAPTIQQFQCELLSGDQSGPGPDVAVAKIATLSEHAFQVPRKVSDFNPILTAGGAMDRLGGSAYDVEQKRIETEIGLLRETLAVVNDKISNMALMNENFAAFLAQIQDLRPRHHSIMTSHNEILNQIFALQLGINKERNLPVPRENKKFRTVDDVDAHIRNLEARMARTLLDIDNAKRIRKVVENFQANSDAIDAKHAAIEKLKEQLDDPEAKAINERFCALVAEMSVMKKKVDLFGNPSLLFEQQSKLQRQINTLFSERYDSISRLREDRLSAERESKMAQIEDQIYDCQMTIEYFSRMSEAAMVNIVKTGEEEDYFVSTKDRSKFKKGPKTTTVTGNRDLSFDTDHPIYAIFVLRSLSILPPSSPSDVPRVVENLKTRKARLEEIANIQKSLLEPIDGAELWGDDVGKPKSEELQGKEVS